MTLPIRNSRIQLPQGTLFWREVGHRQPTVVLLHGTWTDGSQWLPLMAALGQDFHCLAPDLLGFGESSRSAKISYSIALEVESLAAYLTALRSQSVYFIADSLGAWIATRYALTYPEQVQGLFLISPEGVCPANLTGRWQLHRLLAGRFSLTAVILQGLLPLMRSIGKTKWVGRVHHLRRQLLAFPAACRLLFKRRPAELRSELLDGQLPYLTPPLWLLYGTPPSHEALALSDAYAQAVSHSQKIDIAADLKPWDDASDAIATAITPLLKQPCIKKT